MSKKFLMSLSNELHQELSIASAVHKKGMNDILCEALANYLKGIKNAKKN